MTLGWELAWGARTPLTALHPFSLTRGNTIITTAGIGQQLMANQAVCQALRACGQARHGKMAARGTTENTAHTCTLFLILRAQKLHGSHSRLGHASNWPSQGCGCCCYWEDKHSECRFRFWWNHPLVTDTPRARGVALTQQPRLCQRRARITLSAPNGGSITLQVGKPRHGQPPPPVVSYPTNSWS